MLKTILGLPRRVVRRLKNLVDGERSAPSPTPAMHATPPATPAPASEKKAEAAKPKQPPPPPPANVNIHAEPTPNPNAMKFTVGQTICETGSFTFSTHDTQVAHPVARAALAVKGVKTVFGVNDFITVSKFDDAVWDQMTPTLISAIGSSLPPKKG
jgi:hypothetical protein